MRTNPSRCYRWPNYVCADFMAKVWLTVIIQIEKMGDALGMIWLQVVSSEKCYFGGRGKFESVVLLWLP